MVEAATNLFLETLRDLLVEEVKFLLSVRGEVEKVKGDLETIHAMLMKADRERSDSPTLKLYVKQLKALAFEAETLLETYAVEVESKATEGRRSLKERLQRYACILGECFTLHEVGRGTGDILSRLADLTKNLESEFGQKSSTRPGDQEDLLRQTYAHEVEPHFVGMEKEIEEIVSMVKDERKRRPRVVKVYGMGGLGKTTLVRKIYNHGDVAPYARAWVCVTQKFEAKAVLGRILKQLDDKARADSMGVSELVEGIHKFLDKRRSLIVIDDIWENNHWDVIKKAFPMGCNVLLTTRSESIGNVECHPYKLDFPTEDQGWDLLKKIALSKEFDAAEMDLKSLENIGRQIIVKCGHLPLSISVIGGILRQKEERLVAEWERVSMNLDSYLMHGEGVEEYKRVKHVLDLSYDALPYYLKPCFLYLACLPEDEEIKTEKLYLLWMAEGFISYEDKGRNESLRDVAERYLSELATRCMVQVHKGETPLDKFETCRLHDLMHELCSLKAEQENLLKLLGISTYKSTGIPSSDVSFVNRLAIINDSNTDDTLTTDRLQEVKDLRSFIILGKDGHYSPRIHFKDSTANFEKSKCLRLLVLDRCDIDEEKLPTNVDKLIHLRYLSLHYSRVRELPEFVCSMPYVLAHFRPAGMEQ